MSFVPAGSVQATVAVIVPVTGLASVSASVKSLSPIIGGRFGGAAVAASGWLVAWTVAMVGKGAGLIGPELTPRSGGQHPQRRRRRRGERTRARNGASTAANTLASDVAGDFAAVGWGTKTGSAATRLGAGRASAAGAVSTLADDVSAGGAVGLRDAACRDATGADAVDVSADEGVTEDFDFADRFGRDSLASLDV